MTESTFIANNFTVIFLLFTIVSIPFWSEDMELESRQSAFEPGVLLDSFKTYDNALSNKSTNQVKMDNLKKIVLEDPVSTWFFFFSSLFWFFRLILS